MPFIQVVYVPNIRNTDFPDCDTGAPQLALVSCDATLCSAERRMDIAMRIYRTTIMVMGSTKKINVDNWKT